LDRFYSTLKGIQNELAKPISPLRKKIDASIPDECRQTIESFPTRFEEAMDDDFNTAQALGYFYDLQTDLNSLLDISKGQPTEEIISILKKAYDHFTKMGSVFGLFREDPGAYIDKMKKEGLRKLNLLEEEILKLIDERNVARKEKNWKKADEIRSDLFSKGIVLEDTPSGTIWKIK
jgi:cysteinyl-tRNA synthetase